MNEKAKTVHEVAKLTGITARTLHYYDEIGLLKPSIITEAKYRQYTDDDLTRLQEILFFREVGFALDYIFFPFKTNTRERNRIFLFNGSQYF